MDEAAAAWREAQAARDAYRGDGTGFDLAAPLPALDGGDDTTPWDELAAFRAADANLPPVPAGDAPGYIASAPADRPWLLSAKDSHPAIQYVFAALDGGAGHPTERHEGWLTADQLIRRVTRLEDPAQLDAAARARAVDAYTGRRHGCGPYATRFVGPDVFATAVVRAVGHPKTRGVLDGTYDPSDPARPIKLPISDLLGPDGHRFCEGYAIDPVNGSVADAIRLRRQWVVARAGAPQATTAPTASPIGGFEGGTVSIAFKPTVDGRRNQLATMFVNPRQ
ncbi:hypothetical protein [Allonocardiopsis opalescens]|nr:hypothetical protein [Allonocardiopsis opalescens]